MTRIVTSTYRYKRPPRKRKAVGPAVVGQRAPPSQQASTPKPAPASDDDRKSAIVTARRPGARSSVAVPDMTPEEHRWRGDAADALFREIVRRATE